MAATKDRTPSLLDLIGRATEADLSAIDEQIAEKQNELDAATHALQADLDSLRQLRRLIDVKLHGKPARKKTQRKGRGGNGQPTDPADDARSAVVERAVGAHEAALASKIVDLITREGPMTDIVIARKLDRTPQGIRMALTKSAALFRRLPDARVALPGARIEEDDEED